VKDFVGVIVAVGITALIRKIKEREAR